MASIHRRKRSPYWWAAFYLPDGRRAYRSTKVTSRRKALEIALSYTKAAEQGKAGRLTEQNARRIIADIFQVANADKLPTVSVKKYLADWMARKELELADGSVPEYKTTVEGFVKFMGAGAVKPVDAVTAVDAVRFRDHLVGRVAGATVNKKIKLLRVAWNNAIRDGIAQENVFSRVDMVRVRHKQRRAFTIAEVKRILTAAGDEWRGMILMGLYTGQRLSDVANLTWSQVDLPAAEIRFTTKKTGRHMVIPMARPLLDYFLTRPASDDLRAPVFPRAHGMPSNTLSHHFTNLLDDVGLISKPETHKGVGKGRAAKRDVGGLSFHCLRHTATSLLKNAGVSDVVAREIIGHDSEAVSRIYTHIETDTLRQAVARLPDITAK